MTTFPMVANAWGRHASVDFRGTGISETIQVRPSTNPGNPAALADAHHTEALLIRDGDSPRGDRVAYRPWFNLAFGVEPWPYHSPNQTAADRDGPNAWPQVHGPFEPTTLPAHMTAWWDAYNARTVANGTFPDAMVLDNEVRREFYYFATEAQRQAYFSAVTEAGFVVPGLAENPWVGQNIWTYGQPFTDGFIQFWSQWAADDLTVGLDALHGGIWSAPQVASLAAAKAERFGLVPEGDDLDPRPISNYRDAAYAFNFGETFNRPGRLPYAQTRVAQISAPIHYFNRRTQNGAALPLFAAEPEYTTPRAIANRERWKSWGTRISELRACNASEPGDTQPWVQSPGWGWNGGEGWAPLVQLPFELIFWRVGMEHVAAHGIAEVQLWNPIPSVQSPSANDPHAATTHAFMAAWFTGRTVGPLVRDLPAVDIAGTTYTTGGVVTHYADLFEMTEVRYRRAPGTMAVPYLVGWPWSETDPLLISAGPAGDAELAAMLAAVANNQGTPVVAREILTGMENPMPQQVITKAVRTFVKIPSEVLRGTQVSIGMTVELVDGEFGVLGVKAQVRQVKGGELIHDFSPDSAPIVFEDGTGDLAGLKVFRAEVSTADWPIGLCACDVYLIQDSKRFGVARYEWDVIRPFTEIAA